MIGRQLVLPVGLSPDQSACIGDLVAELSTVRGMEAVVLGGSTAQGTRTPASDVDLGLYYRENAPFAVADVGRIAARVAISAPVVTGFYEWGAWVNGGAWISTPVGKVDLLYRNLIQVERTIVEAQAGRATLDYLQQPTFGFQSVIYLAETQICLPLYDPNGTIAGLKTRVAQYPPALKQTVLQDNLWGAEFTLMFARDFAGKGDVYNTVGCLTRAANGLTQALFALNETYFLSDKRALVTLETFALKPGNYSARMMKLLAHPGDEPAALAQSVAALSALFRETVELAQAWYQPRYTFAQDAAR